MQTTANYGLKKSEGTDTVNIDDFNTNSDIVDTELKKRVTTSDYTRQAAYAVDTGSTNTYVVTLDPAPTAYTDGMAVTVKIKTASTGASTLNVNGLGAKAILDSHGNALTAGKLKADLPYTLRYNGTNFILQGEGGEYGTVLPEDVINTKTLGTEQGIKTGTMPSKVGSGTQIVPSNSDQPIPQGYYGGDLADGVVNAIQITPGEIPFSGIKAGSSDNDGHIGWVNAAVFTVNTKGTVRVKINLTQYNQNSSAVAVASAQIYVGSNPIGGQYSVTCYGLGYSSSESLQISKDVSINANDTITVKITSNEAMAHVYATASVQLFIGLTLITVS